VFDYSLFLGESVFVSDLADGGAGVPEAVELSTFVDTESLRARETIRTGFTWGRAAITSAPSLTRPPDVLRGPIPQLVIRRLHRARRVIFFLW